MMQFTPLEDAKELGYFRTNSFGDPAFHQKHAYRRWCLENNRPCVTIKDARKYSFVNMDMMTALCIDPMCVEVIHREEIDAPFTERIGEVYGKYVIRGKNGWSSIGDLCAGYPILQENAETAAKELFAIGAEWAKAYQLPVQRACPR